MDGESKCVVCGCTDRRACDEGCEWILMSPPVCSQCVPRFVIAHFARLLFAVENVGPPAAKRVAGECRRLYEMVGDKRAEQLGIPTLRQVRAIQRRTDKQRQPAAAGVRGGKGR